MLVAGYWMLDAGCWGPVLIWVVTLTEEKRRSKWGRGRREYPMMKGKNCQQSVEYITLFFMLLPI